MPNRRNHAQGPYGFTVGAPLTNGAEEHGFLQPWPTPAEPVNGTGYLYRGLRVLSGPQVYHNLSSPVAGLGGLQTGQIFGQPLVNGDYQPLE